MFLSGHMETTKYLFFSLSQPLPNRWMAQLLESVPIVSPALRVLIGTYIFQVRITESSSVSTAGLAAERYKKG